LKANNVLNDRVASSLVAVASIAAAVFIDVSGGDPSPYTGLAALALGYGAGKQVGKKAARKT